jgi:hypothetical protein
MKKKLFYVVEKELQDIDGIEETTGNKTISVYSIGHKAVEGFLMNKEFDIECTNEENSEEVINDYLIDNGMGDEEFELKQL